MIHPTGYNNYIFTILFAALLIVLPASAFTVAMYGTSWDLILTFIRILS